MRVGKPFSLAQNSLTDRENYLASRYQHGLPKAIALVPKGNRPRLSHLTRRPMVVLAVGGGFSRE